jgi:hypothetical protein
MLRNCTIKLNHETQFKSNPGLTKDCGMSPFGPLDHLARFHCLSRIFLACLTDRMEITEEQLEEFKELYKEEFGIKLSDKDAREIAQRLLGFCLLLCRALPKEGGPENQNQNIEF